MADLINRDDALKAVDNIRKKADAEFDETTEVNRKHECNGILEACNRIGASIRKLAEVAPPKKTDSGDGSET